MSRRGNLSYSAIDRGIFDPISPLVSEQLGRLEGFAAQCAIAGGSFTGFGPRQAAELEEIRQKFTMMKRWQRNAVSYSGTRVRTKRIARAAAMLARALAGTDDASRLATYSLAHLSQDPGWATWLGDLHTHAQLIELQYERARRAGFNLARIDPFQGVVCDLARLFAELGLKVSSRNDEMISPFVSFVGQFFRDMPPDVLLRMQSWDALAKQVSRALRRTCAYWRPSRSNADKVIWSVMGASDAGAAARAAKRTIAGRFLGWSVDR